MLVQLFRIIKLYLGKQQISHYPLFSASISICYIKIKLELLVLHHFDGPFDGKNRSIEWKNLFSIVDGRRKVTSAQLQNEGIGGKASMGRLVCA